MVNKRACLLIEHSVHFARSLQRRGGISSEDLEEEGNSDVHEISDKNNTEVYVDKCYSIC